MPFKLASAVLLTKFGSYRALFNIFDPRGPRGLACATSKIQHAHLRPYSPTHIPNIIKVGYTVPEKFSGQVFE